MAQIDLPGFTGSRTRTRTYDFQNDPSEIIARVAQLICPPGTIIPTLSQIEPNDGWKLCNGQSLSKAAYPRLFSIIGNTFGETETDFALPDLRGRMPIGAGGAAGLAAFAFSGAASITLTIDQMPAHAHAVTDPGHGHAFTGASHSHSLGDPGHGHAVNDPGHTHSAATVRVAGSGAGTATDGAQAGNTGGATTGVTVQASTTGMTVNPAIAGGTVEQDETGISVQEEGGGSPVSILPPVIALYWMVRT